MPAAPAEPASPQAQAHAPDALVLPCDLKAEVAQLERALLERALAAARYNQAEAAKLLGLSYHQLRAQLRKHGINVRRQQQSCA